MIDKRWMKLGDTNKGKLSNEYRDGVLAFVDFAKRVANHDEKIKCPCKKCFNTYMHNLLTVASHLLVNGIMQTYTVWKYHGEVIVEVHGEEEVAPQMTSIDALIEDRIMAENIDHDVSKALKMKLGALRRYNRHMLFQGFEKMVKEKGIEYAKSHPLRDMAHEDWDALITYWSTEKFKNKSKKNSDNRKKSYTNHSCGSKSMDRRAYETLQANGGNLGSFTNFYKSTHYNEKKEAWAAPMCETIHKRMEEDEAIQASTPDIPALTPEQMSLKHLLPRSGYLKGLDMIPTSSIRSTATSSSNSEIAHLRNALEKSQRDFEESKKVIEESKKEIEVQKREMNAVKEFMKSLGYNPSPPPDGGSPVA